MITVERVDIEMEIKRGGGRVQGTGLTEFVVVEKIFGLLTMTLCTSIGYALFHAALTRASC